MRKRCSIIGFLSAVLLGLLICPLQTAAYFGVDEDYLLRTEKPEGRGAGPYHYLEFVSGDTDSYTVQAGDSLWKIARKYYGSGTSYEKLWEENKDRIDTPETLQVGTRLDIDKRFYVNVGMQDYIKATAVMHERSMSGPNAWEWETDGYPYQIFSMMTYRNDLGKKDPYRQWEAFQSEVEDCGRRLCGSRISDLTFERYHVTDVCDLCYYQFVFDGDRGKYLIMTAFVYTGEIENEVFTAQNAYGTLPISHQYMKNETFAVCDLDRCGEAELAEAKGKTFYMAARTIDSLCYLPKMADNVGADGWKYPELHNPFTQAMLSFCDEPLARAESDAGEQEIQWKDPLLEELVREQLAGLWKLTDEERAAFMKRPMTAADLSGVENLYLYENREEKEVSLRLNGYEKSRSTVLFEENSAEGDRPVLTTLDDLAHFTGLRRLEIHLQKSDIIDFSAVGELTGLRELCLEIESAQVKMENEDLAFLGKLKNLRLLYLYGWDHEQGNWAGTEPTYSLEKITDISVLENCRQLAYLKLTTGNVEDYEFLAKLPNLYYIDLMGQDNMLNLKPDTSLMPNACFIEYYGKQIRFDVGGSKEIEDDKY